MSICRCDTKNIGLTMLCKFDGDVPLPAIWSHQVIAEYKKRYGDDELPEFLRWVNCRAMYQLVPQKVPSEGS